MNLRPVMLFIRQRLLLIVWLAVAGCGERESIEGYIAESTAKPGIVPESVPSFPPYQPLPYQASLQRSPFIPVGEGPLIPEPMVHARPEQSLDCEQGMEQALADVEFPALALRATFIGSHHHGDAASALIQVAGADTQTVTIGQQLELEETDKQLEVVAITSQQVTLRQRPVQALGCEYGYTTTLELY